MGRRAPSKKLLQHVTHYIAETVFGRHTGFGRSVGTARDKDGMQYLEPECP